MGTIAAFIVPMCLVLLVSGVEFTVHACTLWCINMTTVAVGHKNLRGGGQSSAHAVQNTKSPN